jgi:hypothetical protein
MLNRTSPTRSFTARKSASLRANRSFLASGSGFQFPRIWISTRVDTTREYTPEYPNSR